MTTLVKFVVEHSKETTIVHEVACEEVFTHSWEFHPGEKRYRILSEKFLDKNEQYSIWYSWAVYDSEALALNAAAGDIRLGMERTETKGGPKFDEQEFTKRVAAITSKRLEK